MSFRIEPSSHSPVSATRSRYAHSAPVERVVDVGSGAGFDTFIAAHHVGADGFVVGVDMTDEMLTKARATTQMLGHFHVEFRRVSPRSYRSKMPGPTS